jgi:Primase C terminal 2 (PriCT-2)
VLIPAARKGPVVHGWQHLVVSTEEVERHLAAGGNVGAIMGSLSGDLVDTDLDCQGCIDLAPIYLPPTPARFGRASKPNSHWLYRSPGAVYEQFSDPLTGEMLVELRADGRDGGRHQTLMPPSVADGERREWEADAGPPAAVDARVLRRRVAYLAVGALIRRYISPSASERPSPDMLSLLWEFDRDLAIPAYRWFDKQTPDQPRRYPKPRAEQTATERDLADIVHAIANTCDWIAWNAIGMAIYAVDGSEHGLVIFDDFSAKSPKYDPHKTKARWRHYDRSPPSRTGLGKLAALARKHGWKPAGQERAA